MCGWAICATAWLLLELILVQQNEFVKSFEGIAEYPWVLLMIGLGRVVTWAVLLFIGAGALRIGSEISFRTRKLVPKANHNDKRKYTKLELTLWGICVVGFFSSLVVGRIWMIQVADFAIGNAEGFVLLLGLIVIPLIAMGAFMLCVLWAIAGVLAIPLVRFTCRWVVFAWIGGCESKPENGGDTMEAF